MPRRPAAFELPATTYALDWERKLRAAAVSIRAEAQGRICGDCARFLGNGCGTTLPIDPAATHSASAVACRAWEPKTAPGKTPRPTLRGKKRSRK